MPPLLLAAATALSAPPPPIALGGKGLAVVLLVVFGIGAVAGAVVLVGTLLRARAKFHPRQARR